MEGGRKKVREARESIKGRMRGVERMICRDEKKVCYLNLNARIDFQKCFVY